MKVNLTKKLIGVFGSLLALVPSVFAEVPKEIFSLNRTISENETKELVGALGPIFELISVLQYIAGVVIILSLIYTGYIYMKGDEASKHQAIQRLGGVLIGAVLIFGAATIARIIFT